MSSVITAFCPGHISGYFKRVTGRDAGTTGSVGAGLVITEGVLARVKPAERTSIRVCKRSPSGALSEISRESTLLSSVLDDLSITASVTTECRLPIGAGFGLSAASLLATITALNQLFNLDMNDLEIAMKAHETEIVHRTGLGDVAACRGGGFVVRNIAGIGAPVKRYFNFTEPIYAISFGPIHTPTVLRSQKQMDRISAAFPDAEPKNIEQFFECSRAFAVNSGLLTPQVKKVLCQCDEFGIPSSMTMLGDGVFAYGNEAKRVLTQFGLTYEMYVAMQGVQIVGNLL